VPDLLVNLLKLPPLESESPEFIVRRAQPFELSALREFVSENFSVSWADEISMGFARQPVSVFVATAERELVGFAAYECTRRGFFGPMGVVDKAQHKGMGRALLLAALAGLRDLGTSMQSSARPAQFASTSPLSTPSSSPTANPASTPTC
jgi:GNAT superfamily N-acetyltransferase